MTEMNNGDIAIISESSVDGGAGITFVNVPSATVNTPQNTPTNILSPAEQILTEFVRDGQQMSVKTHNSELDQWLSGVDSNGDAYTWENGSGRYLYGDSSDYRVGSGDFHVTAELFFRSTDSNPANGFTIDGGNFLFDAGGNLFTESGSLGSATIGPTSDYIARGKRFKFEVIRTGSNLEFKIDDQLVHTKENYPTGSSTFGFRSWRSKLGIYDFYVLSDSSATYEASFETSEGWSTGITVGATITDKQATETVGNITISDNGSPASSAATIITGGDNHWTQDGDQSLYLRAKDASVIINPVSNDGIKEFSFSVLKWTSGESPIYLRVFKKVAGVVTEFTTADTSSDYTAQGLLVNVTNADTHTFTVETEGDVALIFTNNNQDSTPANKGLFIDELSITNFPAVTPVLGLEVIQTGTQLSWFVTDEINVAKYLVVDAITGKTITSVIADNSTSYSIILPEGVNAKLIVIDHSGFQQTFYPENGNLQTTAYALQTGWNLIAITGENADLSNLPIPLWQWNNSAYSTTNKVTPTQAVWVHSDRAYQATVTAEKSTQKIKLSQGWNMVGPVKNVPVMDDALLIYSWSDSYQQVLEDNGTLLQGIGYWIFKL